MNKKEMPIYIRIMISGFVVFLGILTIIATAEQRPTPKITTYNAEYQFSLIQVERPKIADKRYGTQKIDAVETNQKYKSVFEDDMVRILWFVDNKNVSFLLQNKTDHSIKISWDEAAYVDELGRSHRVMHSGIKYTDREKPQAPSVIVRKGSIEDIVYPTDYVIFSSGTKYSAGSWDEKPLLFYKDFHSIDSPGKYNSIDEFGKAVNANIGKQIQILLPLQIQDVINDYIFIFNIDKVNVFKKAY